MSVEPLHDDIWTQRLPDGRANELDNLARVIGTTAVNGPCSCPRPPPGHPVTIHLCL
jgi:hypothetical protein